jgi:hypothetical protein
VLSSSKNTHLYSRPTHQNSPQRSPPPRTQTHQTSHRFSSFVNSCVDSNLNHKACPGLWRRQRQKWSEVCSGIAHRGQAIPLVRVLIEVAQDEGEEEPGGGDEPDDRASFLVGFRHHGACEHRQDGPGSEGLDCGDQIVGGAGEKEVA